MKLIHFLCLFFLLTFSGCTTFQSIAPPTSSPTQPKITPTNSVTPISFATSTLLPTAKLKPSPTIIPSPTQIPILPITQENLYRLEFVANIKFNPHDNYWPLFGLSFSPDSKFIAIGGNNGIEIWNIGSNQKIQTIDILNSNVRYSPDGRLLAFAAREKFGLIDLYDGTILQSFEREYPNYAETILFLPDGENYIVNGKTTEVRRISSGEIIHSFVTGETLSMEMSPDQKLIALGAYQENKVRIYQTSDWKEVKVISCTKNSYMINVSFSSDGKYLACNMARGKGPIVIINTSNWQIYKTISPIWGLDRGDYDHAHVAFTKDSKFVTDSYAFYPISSNEKYIPITTWDGINAGFTFSPDGNFMAGGHSRVTINGIGASEVPLFLYPQNGDILDFKGPYVFQINLPKNSSIFGWKLVQNEKDITGGGNGQKIFRIATNDPIHKKFDRGDLWVRVDYIEDGVLKMKTIVVTLK